MKREFPDKFSKNTQMSNFMKIRQLGPCGRTCCSHFRQLCERA